MKSKKVIARILVLLCLSILFSCAAFSQENIAEPVDTATIVKNISTEIKVEISYCVVQVGAYANIKTKRQFKKEFNFRDYPVYVEKEGDLYKFLIKKKFYNKGGENLFDSNNKVLRNAVRVQMKCKKQFNFVDAFIAVYDKNGKRIAIIKDVPKMKYILF